MDLIETLQNLLGQVPEFVQPLIVAVAGAIPFIEGEGGAAIGIIGGINPVVAAIAAMAGNFLVVAALVLLSSGARNAVVTRHRTRAAARAGGPAGDETVLMTAPAAADGSRSAVRRAKFQRAYERYGVPGVSLLGPLLLPTHFTATMLAASGVGKARILIWQAAAIIAWTTLTALVITGVIQAVR
ncbi:small multidrug efflux protein [Promicromonospora panici]|uniref:small multidrug efflux protein n=1 Tax=Promicromonospora panici TaxID=2219658 RepID=UPI00101B8376|nr:small multidrug efflux protein [Promicromonospora panici]